MLILLPTPTAINAGNENGGEQTIITFYNCTQKAIADSPVEAKVTWAHIKTTMAPLLQKVRSWSSVGYLSACCCCCRRLFGHLVVNPSWPSALHERVFLVPTGTVFDFSLRFCKSKQGSKHSTFFLFVS